MAKRFLPLVFVALGCLTIITGQQARAQLPYIRPSTSPYFRPPVSPYLNLARGNPAINYYGIVRPEQQFYNAFQQLNQQVAMNQQQLGDIEAQATVPTTGHPAYFMNISHYYLSGTGQRMPGRPGTTSSTNPFNRSMTGSSGSTSALRR